MRIDRLLAVALSAAVLAACSTARDVEQQDAAARCTACHGNPPPPFLTGAASHPAGTNCSVCHAETVGPDGELIAGGKHMNGTVDRTGHAPYGAAHTTAALGDIAACASCHGDDYAGGSVGVSCNACHSTVGAGFADWTSNCTFCHGTRTAGASTATALAAPPEAVLGGGDQSPANPAVGAHQAHLAASVACDTCHAVPAAASTLTHFGGASLQATITFGALATQGVTGAAYASGTCNVYCHGAAAGFSGANETPAWASSTALACDACHASRPASGRHTNQPAHNLAACTSCHLGYVQDTTTVPALHVNGVSNVVFTNRVGGTTSTTVPAWNPCTTCHTIQDSGHPNALPFD